MAWIAAIIAGVVGLGSASAQKKAAKKGQGQAAINLEKGYGMAKGEMAPYGDIGKGALYQLAALQGIEGYRTKDEQSYSEFLRTKPVMGAFGQANERDFRTTLDKQEKFATLGDTIGGVTGYFKKRTKKRQAQAVAANAATNARAEAQYKKDLSEWEAKRDSLKAISDESLKTYDPSAVLKATPGYQYRYDTGLGAVTNQQAARNSVLGGRGLKELTQYGQQYATNELSNEVSRLSGLAGMGQNASTALGNLSVGQGSNLANLAMQNAATNSAYYSDLNNVAQSSLGNYLAYKQRNQNPNSRSPYSSSYDSNSPTSNTNYRPGQTLDPENYN